MLALVIVLAATNVATLLVLGRVVRRRRSRANLDPWPAIGASSSSPRRIITVEILNPIELANSRGRMAGLAGSLAPGITRRVVYDQALRTLRRQLAEEQVVADVRLHVIEPQTD